MKKISLLLVLVIVASAVVACGSSETETKSNQVDNKTEVVVNETESNQNKREIEEAPEQPDLWVAYDEFLTIQKRTSSDTSLASVSEIRAIWERIESAKESWKQNPFPFLTRESVETVYTDFLAGAPSSSECQYAINGLVFRGADFETINQLHMLKDNPIKFVEKYNEMRDSF